MDNIQKTNWKDFRTIFFHKTKTLCLICLVYYLFTWKTGCPFRYLLGISCPGCGMTRALLACLRLDFSSAFSFHPLFFLLPIFLLGYYLEPWINWKNTRIVLVLFAFAFLGIYLMRLLVWHDPIVAWHLESGLFSRILLSVPEILQALLPPQP